MARSFPATLSGPALGDVPKRPEGSGHSARKEISSLSPDRGPREGANRGKRGR